MEITEAIYTECINKLDREKIIISAKMDGETPLGFLLTYLPKVCDYGVAERILKHFNIK